jgi:TonB family protein
MKILIAVVLIFPTLAFTQAAPSPTDAPAGNASPTAAANASSATSQADPNWTLAWPTPKEIVLPKAIPGPNCRNRYYPLNSQRLDMSKVSATMVEFHVMPDGSIQDLKLDQSSGLDKLDEAVLSCIKEAWRYTPATYNGTPVEVTRKAKIDWRSKQ